jgi:hypothetical protein
VAQTQSISERTDTPSFPGLTPSELAAMGKKNMDEFAIAQAELFSAMQETHRHWFHRIQSEARLVSEFAHDVTNAGSIPDAVAACQEWTSRRFDMLVDDNKHLLAHSQKVMKAGALLLPNRLFGRGESDVKTGTAGDRGHAGDRRHEADSTHSNDDV